VHPIATAGEVTEAMNSKLAIPKEDRGGQGDFGDLDDLLNGTDSQVW